MNINQIHMAWITEQLRYNTDTNVFLQQILLLELRWTPRLLDPVVKILTCLGSICQMWNLRPVISNGWVILVLPRRLQLFNSMIKDFHLSNFWHSLLHLKFLCRNYLWHDFCISCLQVAFLLTGWLGSFLYKHINLFLFTTALCRHYFLGYRICLEILRTPWCQLLFGSYCTVFSTR